ncbi:IS110 family transposase [Moorella sulfitireducens (nom. illeg.)]|uniref:IS110 family transposase n=1 Tax=Neomoorella sulfitireducens TaxID=2972948 RepID=UPI0021ACCCE4|nr:IS110 family transposase [Moorella sulfitireducens]
MRYFGLDVHKFYCEGAELLPDNTIRRFRFPNEKEEWKRFAKELDGNCKVALEATGNASMIYDILTESLARVVVVNPIRTRAIAEARIKTDKVDAEILVRLLAADFVCACWVASKEERELRTLLHHRAALKKQVVGVKNRIHAVLARHAITVPVSDLFGVKGRQFLRELEELPEVEKIVLTSNLKLFEALEAEIAAIERELNLRAITLSGVEILLGIPGIDVLAALTILAEIGDIKRFASAKKLASFAGLVPSVHQSGKTRYAGHITKAGRSMLRWILIQVAQKAVGQLGALRDFYLRLKKRKGHKVAIVAAARKLLTIIWAMLTKNMEYRHLREDLRQRKIRRMHKRALPYKVGTDLPRKIVYVVKEEGYMAQTPQPAA